MSKEVLLTVFVACYNEELSITSTLISVVDACRELSIEFEIIVIDDASQDNSVRVVQEFCRENPDFPIRLKVNHDNEGLGYNFTEGAFLGTGKYYRLVCGKNGEPKETLKKIFKMIGEADLIIPYHPDGTLGRTWLRRVLSWAFTRIVNALSGHNIKYYNGLAIAPRFQVMRWHSSSRGFGFQADLITRLLDKNLSFIQVPVVAVERKGGRSTAVSIRNLFSVIHTFITIFIRRFAKMIYGKN